MRRAIAAALIAPAIVSAAPLPAPPDAVAPPATAAPVLSAIDRIWAGHSVRFALAVTDDRIVVGYYDANRQLTVASRPRRAAAWVYHKLDSWLGWDSHNYVALAVDPAGQVHVAANMHGDPLVYYRTEEPGDVRTLRRRAVMAAAARERRVTYPVFLRDGSGGGGGSGAGSDGGRLIFKYRDGSSGNGNEIYNVYDHAAGRWSPLLATPLADGEGRRNAYFTGPTRGPDGWFHLAWVWRETPAAETNHDLSYARSRDLVRWETSDGRALPLPIRLAGAEIVDPVPAGGGMINNNTVVGFDPAGATMITYHRFDAAGNTQIMVARREPRRWRIAQVSDWTGFRWDFRGGGSLDSRLFVSGAVPEGRDRIRIAVVRDGAPIDFILDARTLRRLEERPGRSLAAALAPRLMPPPGMTIETVEDAGSGIALAWVTRPPQRDRPSQDIPAPTVLHLVEPR